MNAQSKLRSTALQAVVLATLTATTSAQEITLPTMMVEDLRDSRRDSAMSTAIVRGMRSLPLGGQFASTGARRGVLPTRPRIRLTPL